MLDVVEDVQQVPDEELRHGDLLGGQVRQQLAVVFEEFDEHGQLVCRAIQSQGVFHRIRRRTGRCSSCRRRCCGGCRIGRICECIQLLLLLLRRRLGDQFGDPLFTFQPTRLHLLQHFLCLLIQQQLLLMQQHRLVGLGDDGHAVQTALVQHALQMVVLQRQRVQLRLQIVNLRDRLVDFLFEIGFDPLVLRVFFAVGTQQGVVVVDRLVVHVQHLLEQRLRDVHVLLRRARRRWQLGRRGGLWRVHREILLLLKQDVPRRLALVGLWSTGVIGVMNGGRVHRHDGFVAVAAAVGAVLGT